MQPNNYQLLKSRLNGKTKEEVEAYLASLVGKYDKTKYEVVESPFANTLSGYDVAFTRSYFDKMKKMIPDADIKTYIKLDEFLSQGYEITQHRVEELCLSKHDINTGRGTVPVEVYTLEDMVNWLQATIVVYNGQLVPGSYAIIARRSRVFMEQRQGDLMKQDYLMGELDISRQKAAYLVKQLNAWNENNDEEKEAEELAQELKETAHDILYTIPLIDMEYPRGVAHELYHTGKERTLTALTTLAGSDLQEFILYMNNRTMYTNMEIISTLRDILIGLVKKEFLDTLNQGITAYRKLAEEIKEECADEESYPPYTPVTELSIIAPIAEVTNTRAETLVFIVEHGTWEDLQEYLTVYHRQEDDAIISQSAPEWFVKVLFDTMTAQYYNVSKDKVSTIDPFYGRDLVALINAIESSQFSNRKMKEVERNLIKKVAQFNANAKIPMDDILFKAFAVCRSQKTEEVKLKELDRLLAV